MSARDLSLPRKLLFSALLTGGMLAVLFGTLEAGLRLAGFGYSPHFFRRARADDGTPVWRENRWCTAPFFSAALVRRPQAVRLPATKAPGTYRVFVLGSSAAMGDPEPAFSLARMLETMLRTAYPERHFEVVNAAITAINSHVMRGIAEDCARLQPDLLVVYEGNNEVIGPFGPAGVFTAFLRSEPAIRGSIWLRTTRVGQLLATLGRRGKPAEWGGMEMFLRQKITADDPRLDAVQAHFRANLRAVVAAGRRAGATTLLCTVATNLRDFAPFLALHRPGFTTEDSNRWDALVATAGRAEAAGDLAAAAAAYREAAALDDRHAGLAFARGRLALKAGRDQEARELLQRALDLDALRFRTDSRLNEVIREVGTERQPGVEFVDLAAALAARSPHGIPGDELFYEHVHLTFRGTYEAACELFPHVVADLQRRGLADHAAAVPFDYEEARLRLGFNIYEQAMIGQELLRRFGQPPFSGQPGDNARYRLWEQRAEEAGRLLARPDATAALQELARRALTLAPDDWLLARNTGAMLVARGEAAAALPLLERADRWINDDVDTLVALGHAETALGHEPEAAAAYARARRLEPDYPGLPPLPGNGR
ncbi:MAG TPA: hypothetical protein VL200_13885 [Lacunisphaera sp.]|jgi:tetratricopeptide (TPR) repeat protein|nr:hypothetical protein [Lacunisphaera sp.]